MRCGVGNLGVSFSSGLGGGNNDQSWWRTTFSDMPSLRKSAAIDIKMKKQQVTMRSARVCHLEHSQRFTMMFPMDKFHPVALERQLPNPTQPQSLFSLACKGHFCSRTEGVPLMFVLGVCIG